MVYELSKYIELLSLNKKYLIRYTTIDKEIIINESIFFFLNKIQEINNYKEIIELIASNNTLLNDKLDQLLIYFIKLGVIVEKGKEGIAIDYAIKFEVNTQIDNYRIVNTISNRKSGELYKVVDGKNNYYVLKTLREKKFPNKKTYKKSLISFEKENNHGSLLNYKHLCKINKGVFEKDWGAYYIMEYIDGCPISNFEYIESQNKKNIFMQILKGFDYIHEMKMLHGDIHLNNILITNDSKVKIIDYGLTSNLLEKKSHNGGVCEFIAPERMSADIIEKFSNKNTIKSEIYQLGVLYYFILTNTLPYKSNTWKGIYNEKLNFNINDFPAVKSFSDSDIQIIERCLSPKPNDRFSSIKEIIKKIEE